MESPSQVEKLFATGGLPDGGDSPIVNPALNRISHVKFLDYNKAPRLVTMQISLESINAVIGGLCDYIEESQLGGGGEILETQAQQVAQKIEPKKFKQALIALCTFKKLVISHTKNGEKCFKF